MTLASVRRRRRRRNGKRKREREKKISIPKHSKASAYKDGIQVRKTELSARGLQDTCSLLKILSLTIHKRTHTHSHTHTV